MERSFGDYLTLASRVQDLGFGRVERGVNTRKHVYMNA